MANTPSNKQLSRALNIRLDDLGFGKIERWERIHHQNIQTRVKNLSMKLCINTNNECISVGSHQEGIGLSGFADTDVLQVEHDVLCIDQLRSVQHDNILVLNIVESNAPPGYCILELSNSANTTEAFENYKYARVDRNNQSYIGSKLFLTKHNDDNVKVSEYTKTNTCYHPHTGPSIPKSVFNLFHSLVTWYGLNSMTKNDFVRAFPCDGHLALKSWQQRPRPNNWPSKKMVRHIMTLPIYVVPVGLPGSLNEDIQWRISYVRAETYLVQTLNSVQAKILVVLKLVGKIYLKKSCPSISSYILKNVMFLLAESFPQKNFRQKHMLARLKDAFELLKDAVKKKKLPSYMQPEKNLFADKLSAAEQKEALGRIDYLLRNDKMLVNTFLDEEQLVGIKHKMDYIILLYIRRSHELMKREICTLGMYPFQSQVLYYMTSYKLNFEEEHIIHNIPSCPMFIWKYGIKGWMDARTVNLYKPLADFDRDGKIRKMEDEMLHNSDTIRRNVYISCALLSFLRFCLITVVLLSRTALLMVVSLIMIDPIRTCTDVAVMLCLFLLFRYE